MTDIIQAECRNLLLGLMSADDFARLVPHLVPVKLPRGFVMVEADGIIEHIYFLESGVSSIVAISPEGHEIEAGLTGLEGVVPYTALLGAEESPTRVMIQVVDDAYRIDRIVIVQAMEESASLRNLLLRFAQVMNTQTTFTALSNAIHSVDERLARWILMCHDRHASDEIPLTHEFLSIMLCVRRPSVTTSLHVLEGNGFIRNERGLVTVRNRSALEDFAGDAYGRPEAEYRRLIGPFSTQHN